MNGEAIDALKKFSEMRKKVTAPWSKERPHDIACTKTAESEGHENPMNTRMPIDRPKVRPYIPTNMPGAEGRLGQEDEATENGFTQTPALPTDESSIDNYITSGTEAG